MAIVNTINQPLLVLDDKLNILTVNPAFNQRFNKTDENLSGRSLFTINQSVWDSTELRAALAKTQNKAIVFNELHVDIVFPGMDLRKLIINGRLLKQSSIGQALILLAI